jgi:hypothetical protein
MEHLCYSCGRHLYNVSVCWLWRRALRHVRPIGRFRGRRHGPTHWWHGLRKCPRLANDRQRKSLTARPLAGRASKEAGVTFSQDAENGGRLQTDCSSPPEPERPGERDGHGTARLEMDGAASTRRGWSQSGGLSQSDGIPRSLRPQRSGGYAASTSSDAYLGVPKEAAAL